ncbi:MAG: hypothetical protein ACK40Y_10710, partial [Cloacibacterium caeni]
LLLFCSFVQMMSSRKDRFIIFSISFCKIKSNQIIFNNLIGALAKNGSFGFLSFGLCVGAKANLPFAGWHKITRLYNLSFSGARECFAFVFKKCAMGKK